MNPGLFARKSWETYGSFGLGILTTSCPDNGETGAKDMAKTKEEWLAEAAAAEPDGTYIGLVPMAKCRNIDAGEVMRYGEFQWTTLDKALAGESRGLWEIVECLGSNRE